MEKDLKKLAGDVVGAVEDLSNYLEETEGIFTGIDNQGERTRKLVSEALSTYPDSQIGLVLECLQAEGRMDTRKEALAYMDIEESDEEGQQLNLEK